MRRVIFSYSETMVHVYQLPSVAEEFLFAKRLIRRFLLRLWKFVTRIERARVNNDESWTSIMREHYMGGRLGKKCVFFHNNKLWIDCWMYVNCVTRHVLCLVHLGFRQKLFNEILIKLRFFISNKILFEYYGYCVWLWRILLLDLWN